MDPWRKAYEEYTKGLTEEEKNLFASSKPEDILAEVRRAEQVHRGKSRTRALTDKIKPLLAAIEQYGTALDVIANSNSSVLSPLWGSLRMLLRVAREFQTYFPRLLEMLEHIGDVLPRYGTYSILFRKHAPLQKALSSIYVQIIHFCMDARRIFSKERFRTFPNLVWKPFNEEFGDTIDKFSRYRQLVEDEARLAHMVESMQERNESCIERVRMAKERELAEESRKVVMDIKGTVDMREKCENMIAIKKWIDGRTCTAEKQGLKQNRLPGSCEWILQNEELSRWCSDGQTRILWVDGNPGCGKSFAYSRLLCQLDKQCSPTLYFLFCASDHERDTSSSLIRSWLLQLTERFPETVSLVDGFMRGNEHRLATQGEASELLLLLLDSIPQCYLTADGMDECVDRGEFFRLLPQILRRHKVLLFSRATPDICNSLLQRSTQLARIHIDWECTKSDIDSYISHRLTTEFAAFDGTLTDKIRTRLVDCQGMFLWVRLMFDTLLMQTTMEELLNSLDQLPIGLDATYDRVLKAINELPPARRLLANKILFWVVFARRPLSVAEIRALLAIRPGDREFYKKRLVINVQGTIPSICAPLLEVRVPENTINTVHFTVNQYLARYIEENQILQEITADYEYGQFQSGNKLAAAVCLTYLSFPAISNLPQPSNCLQANEIVSTNLPVLSLLLYASIYWFKHLQQVPPSETSLDDLVQTFMDPKSSNMETWWRFYWFLGADSQESVICPSRFSQIHVAAYLGLDKVIPILASESDCAIFDSRGRTPLWWACTMGHTSATAALLEAGFNPNTPDHDSVTPAHRAAAGGHSEVFEIILTYLQTQARENRRVVADSEGWTPLHWAAARNTITIIKQILNRGREEYGVYTSKAVSGRIPLQLAALNGHVAAIRALHSSFVNMQDNHGSTALHLAAMQGHMGAVKALVDMHADISVCDSAGKAAAERASITGHDDIASLLNCMKISASPTANEFSPGTSTREWTYIAGHVIDGDYFLDKILESNSRDSHDISLIESCVNGHWQSLKLLDSKGRDWGISDGHRRTTLHHAAAGGYDQFVEKILELCALKFNLSDDFINKEDDRGWTALHYAVAGNFDVVVKQLLDAGASPYKANGKGDTPYAIAVRVGHQAVLECMAKFSTFSTEDLAPDFHWTSLHCYARNGDLASVKRAIENSEDLKGKDRFERMPIFRALDNGKSDVVTALAGAMVFSAEELLDLVAASSNDEAMAEFFLGLLPRDQSLLKRELEPKTQLLFLWAVERGNESIAKTLCDNGADVNVYDPASMDTALHIAIERQYSSLAEFLIRQGAIISIPNGDSKFPLHQACENGQFSVVKCLLSNGADVNQQVNSMKFHGRGTCLDGRTPLHFAIKCSQNVGLEPRLDVIQCLLEHGADINIEDSTGQSPIWLAHEQVEWARFVGNKSGAKVASTILQAVGQHQEGLVQPISEGGLTPLHIAASTGDVQMVRYILDTGVPVDWESFSYRKESTALLFAIENGHLEVVKLLLDFGAKLYPRKTEGKRRTYFMDRARQLGHEEILKELLKVEKQRLGEEIS